MIYIKCTNTAVARKGRLDEIFSKALYADDGSLYSVSYRNFETIDEVPLLEFVELSEDFQVIPQSRIMLVKKDNHVLYRKHGYLDSATQPSGSMMSPDLPVAVA